MSHMTESCFSTTISTIFLKLEFSWPYSTTSTLMTYFHPSTDGTSNDFKSTRLVGTVRHPVSRANSVTVAIHPLRLWMHTVAAWMQYKDYSLRSTTWTTMLGHSVTLLSELQDTGAFLEPLRSLFVRSIALIGGALRMRASSFFRYLYTDNTPQEYKER